MRHAKKYAVALAITTLLYNNCSGFKGVGSNVTNLASSAGSGGGGTTPPFPPATKGVDPNPTPTPKPLGTPVPPYPSTLTPVTTYPTKQAELPKYPSNFVVSDWVGVDPLPDDTKTAYFFPDDVGAFRFQCKPSHNLYDDPIVYPGQPGASHLHTFFGNSLTNANSTYQSLRTSGEGTCNGGPLNRSAYWMPALRIDDGDGNDLNDKVVMPDFVTIYYKTGPEEARMFARGMRMIFGYNMSDPSKSSGFTWGCIATKTSPGLPGTFRNLQEVAAAGCPAGSQLDARLSGPTCWNGQLDSPDHRSHLAFPQDSHLGYAACPATHPYHFPSFTLAAMFTVGPGGPAEIAKMYLSSDHMAGMAPMTPGSTFHTDWFGAWDDDIVAAWMMHSDADFRNNSSGNMGDGRGLIDPYGLPNANGYTSVLNNANPRIVDPPVHP